jgi:ornithine cyclodeaminase/alanine dehydrogenase-like protein (mu-crystallin family)
VPLYLTEADVEALFSPADAVAAVEDSFRRLASGEVVNKPRYRVVTEGVSLAVMSAVDAVLRLAGVKSYAVSSTGVPFVVTLFDTETGELAAVIEADRLGQLRTGAASAVAAKYLTREGATSLGIIGCGWQAESQVRCIREAVPTIDRVVAYCRTEPSLQEFCSRLDAELGESHRDPAEQDIVVTATTSKDPVLRGEWLRPGALVCAMGANDLRRRELDNAVLERASFVCCDSIEQSKLESGDLVEPIEQGILDWLEVHELQEVVAGEVQGRQSDDDIVVFKSNGLAAWDVAAGARTLELAREQGKGAPV